MPSDVHDYIQGLDFDPELNLALDDTHVLVPPGHPRIGLKIADVKSMGSAQTKLARLQGCPWANRRPLAGYVTDWNRSMQIAEDPFVLAVALLMLSHMFP